MHTKEPGFWDNGYCTICLHNTTRCECCRCGCNETDKVIVDAAFMAKVRELCDHYHAFGIVEASPDFHKLCRELAALLPPETPS